MVAPSAASPPLDRLSAVTARGFAAPTEVIAAVLDLARDLLGVGTAVVARLDDGTWHAAHVADAAFGIAPGDALPLRDTLCRLVGVDEPLVLGDVSAAPNADADASAGGVAAALRLGVRTFVGVPLVLRDGTAYGTLCAFDRRPGAPAAEAVSALRVLARLVAHELEHERSLAVARVEGERAAAAAARAEAAGRDQTAIAALLRAAVALNEAGSLEALMPALAAAAAEAVGADRASVYAYDESRGGTVAAGHYAPGDPAGVRSVPDALKGVDDLAPLQIAAEAEVLRTGRPLPRHDRTHFPSPCPPDDWCSDIVVPLLAAGAVQGVLCARNVGRERVFSKEEVALLQAIENQAGLAILRAREVEDGGMRPISRRSWRRPARSRR